MTRERWADERGVFMPGLMGAGILVSMVMLVADALRRAVPWDGERGAAARREAAALGRVEDVLAVVRSHGPSPVPPHRVARSRGTAVALGLASVGTGALAVRWALDAYYAPTGVLADRGWTLGWGLIAAVLVGGAGVAWLSSAALGERRPAWLERAATTWPLGTFPEPPEESP